MCPACQVLSHSFAERVQGYGAEQQFVVGVENAVVAAVAVKRGWVVETAVVIPQSFVAIDDLVA